MANNASTVTQVPRERWEAVGQCIRTLTNPDRTGGILIAEVPVYRPDLDSITTKIATIPEMLDVLDAVDKLFTEGVANGFDGRTAALFAVHDMVRAVRIKVGG
ncbi:MAG: hypothetical protein V4757_07360 [Pseudomonadota bacterium]